MRPGSLGCRPRRPTTSARRSSGSACLSRCSPTQVCISGRSWPGSRTPLVDGYMKKGDTEGAPSPGAAPDGTPPAEEESPSEHTA